MHRYNRADQKRTKAIVFAIPVIIAIVVFIFNKTAGNDESGKTTKQKNALKKDGYNIVHFIDAGQGDCTLIETVDGKFALIDASTDDFSDKVTKYLKDQGVSELEYVFFTHPHEDHIGGADEVLDTFKVKTVIMTRKTEATSAYKNLTSSIKKSRNKHGTKVISPKEGDILRLSDTVFTVISDGEGYDNLNDSSICLKMELGGSSFIFTGDAEKVVENDILNSGFDIDADVYKCGHHGSSTSTSEEFLDRISPDYAIVSCGKDNDYGHPHREVVSALNKRNIPMLITHEQGDILIGYNAHSIVVK